MDERRREAVAAWKRHIRLFELEHAAELEELEREYWHDVWADETYG